MARREASRFYNLNKQIPPSEIGERASNKEKEKQQVIVMLICNYLKVCLKYTEWLTISQKDKDCNL